MSSPVLFLPTELEYQDQILGQILDSAAFRRGRLFFVMGGNWAQRTQLLQLMAERMAFSYVPIGLRLGERLQDLPVRRRSLAVDEEVRNLCAAADPPNAAGCVLDHIEILLLPDLQVAVYGLFERLSRHQPLLISWPGQYENGRLVYAQPGHPEYFAQRVPNLLFHRCEDVV